MCVCVICFSCISVTGDPKVVLSVKSPPLGQRYGQWSGSWQLYATKNGGETEFRKRGFIENIWKHVSTSPFLHIKRLVLDLGSSSFPSMIPNLASMIPTILLLMLDPSQPQYIRSKSYSLLHCWPSTTLGHEMTPRGLRKSSTHTVDWNSSHQPYDPTAFGGGRVESTKKLNQQFQEVFIHRNVVFICLQVFDRSLYLGFSRYARNLKQATSDSLSTLELKIMVLCSDMCSKCCRLQPYSMIHDQAKLPIRSQAACWISVVVKIGRCLEFLSESSDNRNFWTHPVSYLGSSVKR